MKKAEVEKNIIELIKGMERMTAQMSILWKVFSVIGGAMILQILARIFKLI